MTELEATARALVAAGKGILAADESSGTIAKRFDAVGVESTEETRRAYRELLFTTDGAAEHISGVILFDETIRQSAADGTPFPELLAAAGDHPRDQGRPRREAARARAGRDDHRGPRRAARALRGVPRARRTLRQVARGDLDRQGHPERVLHLDERPRARPLRRARAGGGPRADRRARGADGRRPHDRALVRGHLARPARGVHRAARPARPARGDAAEAEHGAVGLRLPRAGRASTRSPRRRSRLPAPQRPGGGAGDRLPLGRPERRGRDRAPRRDQPRRAQPWQLSFSYGRALQAPAQKAWAGEAANVEAGKAAYLKRARLNGAARSGTYDPAQETAAA